VLETLAEIIGELRNISPLGKEKHGKED